MPGKKTNKLNKNIYLVGFMGAGKSSVGRFLASELGLEFVDLDEMIEKHTGLTINELFEKLGEAGFRKIESELLLKLTTKLNQVIALGGGTFCKNENIQLIKSSGISIWLHCPVEELISRCFKFHPHRPLANDKDKFKELYLFRLSFYNQADFKVNTNARTINVVAREIVEILRLKGFLN